MIDQKDWESEVREVYDRIKSHKKSYEINIDGLSLTVLPDVFSPHYFTDSFWFAKTLPKITKKASLLEIGTGTGIIAIFCALKGAKVTATDINPQAIKNAKFNFDKLNLDIPIFLGDMYKPLPKYKKFNFIFWNHPFNKGHNPKEEMLLKSGFDFNYNYLKDYVKDAKNHLTKNGRLLLGSGNFALTKEIKKIGKENNYKIKILKKTKIPIAASSEIDNEYRLYEFIS